jgi:hypothetical protein
MTMRKIVAMLLLVGSTLDVYARAKLESPLFDTGTLLGVREFVYGKSSAWDLHATETLIEKFWRDLEHRLMKCAPNEYIVIELEEGWSDKIKGAYCKTG